MKNLICSILILVFIFFKTEYIISNYRTVEKKILYPKVITSEIQYTKFEVIEKERNKLRAEEERNKKEKERKEMKKTGQMFKITFYDLSVQSCGKLPGNYGYGITATGFNLSGHTWKTARAIAVDPSVIKLGSKVQIVFEDTNYSFMNGIYNAVDTGSAIHVNIIDFYLGENCTQQAISYGVQNAWIKVN